MNTVQALLQAKSKEEVRQLLVPLRLQGGVSKNRLSQALWNVAQKNATLEDREIIKRASAKQIAATPQEPTEPAQKPPEPPKPGKETGKNKSGSQRLPEASTRKSESVTSSNGSDRIQDQTEATPDEDSKPSHAKLKGVDRKEPEAKEAPEGYYLVAGIHVPLPKKAQAIEEILAVGVPPEWREESFLWEEWSALPTSSPSTEEFPHRLKRSTEARDKRDYAVKVWDREVSRTFHNKEGYWYLKDDGRWGLYSKEDLLNILEGAGLFSNRPPGREAGAAWYRDKSKAFLRRVLTRNQVDFVGELAGHKTGVIPWKGDKYLIRKGPEIIEPAPGDCYPVKGLLLDLLGEEQFIYFKGWAKTSYEALRDGEKSTGQMLVLSGPPGIGKSFVKEFIIRPILGGRHTDPTSYLHGKTNFNADTARAESWEIDDSVGTSDSNKRKMLTGAIKKLTASNDHRVEGKHKDGIQPPPVFHRLSVFTNDEAYDLWVLPEMTGSTKDKAIILKAHKTENPRVKLPGVNEREEFRQQIENALPAFIQQELLDWKIPDELKNGRYGIKAYQHKELEDALHQMSDESRLLEMIDILLPLSEPWEGTVGGLELELRANARNSGMSKELEKVLWNRQTLGNGLGKLRKTSPDRIELKKKNWKGYTVWVLHPRLIGEAEEEPKSRKTEISYQR